ncbi:DNA recombination and repair protein RecF [Lachnospiraceae bacterium TWA4]|nr:DNA recombination and repair protein RecF [Lachnospiraceae bacterium TWA4]
MIIKRIELSNFRNYKELSLDFDKGTNIFYGDNAQGKTNILESIRLCSNAKSHRTNKDRELILFGEEEAHIKLFLEKKFSDYRIDVHLKSNRPKGIAVNGMPIRKISELLGILNVVFFSPEDLSLIKRGPSERRRFLDFELCQLNPLYTSSLASYHKALNQKNHLLKEVAFHPEWMDTLDSWDEQLERYAKDVILHRKNFLESLNEVILEIHKNLTSGKEQLEVLYEPNVLSSEIHTKLKSFRERELKQRISLVGPHRDDICFLINGMDIRKFGSQGQQRTAALSLKLAEIVLIKKQSDEYPILLLDDVMSELDSHRQLQLLNHVAHVQTMLTCTGLDDLESCNFPINKLFYVNSGEVICKKEQTSV